jgi:MFS family permease
MFVFFADGFPSGLLFYGFTGLCSGASYTPGLPPVAERFTPHERGRAMGWSPAEASLGYGASLFLSGILIPHVGRRGAFIAACGPIAAMVISFWTLRTTPNIVYPHGRLVGER